MSILGQVFTYMFVIYAITLPAYYVYCAMMDKHRLGGQKPYPVRTAIRGAEASRHQSDAQLMLAAGF